MGKKAFAGQDEQLVTLQVHLERGLKDKLYQRAEKDSRTMSGLVRLLIKEAVS